MSVKESKKTKKQLREESATKEHLDRYERLILGCEKALELQNMRIGALSFIKDSPMVAYLSHYGNSSSDRIKLDEAFSTLHYILHNDLVRLKGEYFTFKSMLFTTPGYKPKNEDKQKLEVTKKVLEELAISIASNHHHYWNSTKFDYLKENEIPKLLKQVQDAVGDKRPYDEIIHNKSNSPNVYLCCLCQSENTMSVQVDKAEYNQRFDESTATVSLCAKCLENTLHAKVVLDKEKSENLKQILVGML